MGETGVGILPTVAGLNIRLSNADSTFFLHLRLNEAENRPASS